jgi:hypothetical protein
MWIHECHELYTEFVERVSGTRVTPGLLEQALSAARAKRLVGSEELRIIEESPYWPYPQWWPRLSTQFGQPLLLPSGKEEMVKRLLARTKHIEVVSVALRFMFPEEFGIMSPPVIGLLNLAGTDYEDQYLRYLSGLEKIRQHYEGLERIADVDMALWAAAHLHFYRTEYPAILEEMLQDRAFQEIRLTNMLGSLGRSWERSERARLILAENLLKHDHVLAALIAARCFEAKVVEMAEYRKITAGGYRGENKLHSLVRKLESQAGVVPTGVSLDALRELRNDAVHDFDPPIPKDKARVLMEGVRRLYGA